MNESKTNDFRYIIAYLLDNLAVGEEFDSSVLHITVLPWFALETDEQPFIDWFYKHFDEVKAFDAIVGQKRMFGPKQNVPVNIMEPQEEFMKLHKLALSWFGEVGARWAENDPYVGDDYIPHIAQRHGYKLYESEKLEIGSLTLFKALRVEDHIRSVAAKAIFDEKN